MYHHSNTGKYLCLPLNGLADTGAQVPGHWAGNLQKDLKVTILYMLELLIFGNLKISVGLNQISGPVGTHRKVFCSYAR